MRRFGLIGFPLGQSFSKKFFTEKFAAEGLHDCVYEAFSIESINELNNVLKDPELEGLNVTIPHKKSVIPFLHERSEVVEKIQACNCIKIKNNRLIGYNTDVIGFEKSLKPLLLSHHKKALILGTGGAAAAIEFVLQKLGIEYVFVSRKSGENRLLISYDDSSELLATHQVVINTTPVGMFPDMKASPSIAYQLLTPKHLLYDVVYNPAETTFLRIGKLQGAAVKNGEEMLIIQAEESWNIWNNE